MVTSLASKTLWSAIATVLAGASGLAATIVVARLLGPAGMGDVAYAVWIATTAAQVAGLALPQVAMTFLPAAEPAGADAIRRWVLRRSAVLVLPGVGVVLAIVAAGGKAREPALVAATAAMLVAQMFASLAQGILSGEQRFRALAALTGIGSVVQIAAVAAGGAIAGAVGAVAGYAAGLLPVAIAVLARPRPAQLGGVVPAARLRTFALHTWIAIVVSLFAWSRLEIMFLEHSSGARGVAMYSVALTVAQLAVQPTALLAGALLPHFAALVGREQLQAAQETYAAATRVFAAIAFPLCFGLAALSPSLVPLVFGGDYREAVVPAAIVAAASAFGAIGTAGSSLLYALEKASFIGRAGVAIALAAVGAFWVAIPVWGPLGAAAARALLQVASVAIGTVYIAHVLRVAVPVGRAARAALASAVSAGAAVAVVLLVNGWAGVLLAFAAFAIVYLVGARALRVIERSDADHLVRWISGAPGAVRAPAAALVRSLAP